MLRTKFTELVGCTVPIQQAPIGSLSNPGLAAAVANAGGLGMIAVSGAGAEEIARLLDDTRKLTSGPFGANFIVHFMDRASVGECIKAAAARARVVEFFYSQPDPALIEIVHGGGALAAWQVGSFDEAVAAEKAGCDFIIAQGIEAGGHIRGVTGLLALLSEVLDTIKVPVLAAGGVGTGRAMAAAMAAGAEGVRVGTRFVAAEEAEAHPDYVNALIAAEAEDTVYTDIFSYGWPDAPHRVLRACVDAVRDFEGDIVGQRYWPDEDEWQPLHRFGSVSISKYIRGAIEAMSQWAGESVGGVKRVQPAAEIVEELAGQAEELLRRWG